MYTTKTEQAVTLWKQGEQVKALKMFKSFKMGVNKEQAEVMQIAFEMKSGNLQFYSSLGYQLDEVWSKAVQVVNDLFIN